MMWIRGQFWVVMKLGVCDWGVGVVFGGSWRIDLGVALGKQER